MWREKDRHRAMKQNELVSGKLQSKPPARTSESNCWQINGHMVDWLPLAQTHTVHCSVCKCVCPGYHLSFSPSLLPSIHPSLLPSLWPLLSSTVWVSVSLSVFLLRLNSLAHSSYNVTHSHHPNTSPSPALLPAAVEVCVHASVHACVHVWQHEVTACHTVDIYSSPTLAKLQLHNLWLIRKNGFIWRWKRTLMKVRDQTDLLCLSCQLWGGYHNSPRPNHTSRKGDLSSVRVDQSIVPAIRLDSLLHKR